MVRDPESGDTIVALATPPGRSAIAVVRVSGERSADVLRGTFRSPRAPRPREVTLGDVVDSSGSTIDRSLAVFYQAPRSYTGEDMVEFFVHGSGVVTRALIDACRAAGARHAEPGEFTKRALENGKLDLTQAEAVSDLIDAATVEQARIASRQLVGEVSAALEPIGEALADLLADVEADLDFADEEDLAAPGSRTAGRCRELAARLERLIRDSGDAARIKDGARVVLAGPPNSGKSSLFNNLAHMDRVIVSPEPGTTRDLIEEVLDLEGLPVVLVDGAGVGDPAGLAEAEAMRRARGAASTAALVLDVYDLRASPPRPVAETGGPAVARILVGTHRDLGPDVQLPEGAVAISNLTGEGIEELRGRIAGVLGAPGTRAVESVALASERHRERAMFCREALERGARLAESGEPLELCAIELRSAVRALHEILGHVGPEELLGRIFSRFCIGK